MGSVRMEETVTTPRDLGKQSRQLANSSICWGAIFGGLFVSVLTYFLLVGVGLAFGSSSLEDNIENWRALKSLGVGASVWAIFSVLLSIFTGAYLSGRVAGQITTRIGRVQGLVIASLFFMLMLAQTGFLVGGVVSGLGSVVSTVAGGSLSAASSVRGQQVIENSVTGLVLKSPMPEVVRGLAARLMSGDDRSAISYLANQAGLSETDASNRYLSFKAQFLDVGREAAISAAQMLRYAGITLVLAIVFGALGATIGGGLGARDNLTTPLSRMDYSALHTVVSALAMILLLATALLPNRGWTQPSVTTTVEHKTLTNAEKTDQLGLGVEIGTLSGISGEYWLTNDRTINAAIVGEQQSLAVQVSYRWVFRDVFPAEFRHFVPFVGAGGVAANGTRSDVFSRTSDQNFALAAQVPVGLEYLPQLHRFGVFAEISPSLEVAPTAYGFLTGGVGAMYYF